MTPVAQKIEALLFGAGEAVPKVELVKAVGESRQVVEEALNEIHQALADHGLALLATDTHAELVTSPAVANWLGQWWASDAGELSKAATETLAIIAYRGPLARYDIDVIRGVDSRHTLRQLLHRGLLRRALGAAPTPRYEITEEFLKRLGLTSRQQLPQFDQLSSHEKLEQLLTRQEARL